MLGCSRSSTAATCTSSPCGQDQLNQVAKVLAERERPSITTLRLVQEDFDPGSEPTGNVAMNKRDAAALWGKLPSLTRLVLQGHQLFAELELPTLEALEISGYPVDRLWVGKNLGGLESFAWESPTDHHGVAMEPEGLMCLFDGTFPKLRHLDLSRVVVECEDLRSVPAIAKSPGFRSLESCVRRRAGSELAARVDVRQEVSTEARRWQADRGAGGRRQAGRPPRARPGTDIADVRRGAIRAGLHRGSGERQRPRR